MDSGSKAEGQGELEVHISKNRARVSLHLDAAAVTRCLEKDGVLTIRFQEVGSTRLTDLPNNAVIVN